MLLFIDVYFSIFFYFFILLSYRNKNDKYNIFHNDNFNNIFGS